MKFIVVQTILIKREQKGNIVNNYWDNIIRQVDAKDRETAIGKFVIQTANIEAKEKLQIECIQLSHLTALN